MDSKTHHEGNTCPIVPPTYNFAFHEAGLDSEHCAAIKARLGAGYRYPFAGIGVNLSRTKHFYDFTRVSALEFTARGKGVFKVKLRDHWSLYSSSADDRNLEFYHEFRVGPEWRRYVLPIADFDVSFQSPIHNAGLTWQDVGDSIQTMIFVSSSYHDRDAPLEVELQLDNIVLRGLDTVGVAVRGAPPSETQSVRTDVRLEIDSDGGEEPCLDDHE
jgi:hypothetical protein